MPISIVKVPELIVMYSLYLSSTRKQTPSSPPVSLDFRALKPVGGLRMSMSTDYEVRAELIPNGEQQPKKRFWSAQSAALSSVEAGNSAELDRIHSC